MIVSDLLEIMGVHVFRSSGKREGNKKKRRGPRMDTWRRTRLALV
jgi:hypothetical protein